MKWAAAAAIAGLVLATVLAAKAGLADVASSLADLGFLGLVWLCVIQLGGLCLCAGAWRLLSERAGFGACLSARWVRDGVSNLLGIVPGVGEAAGARALALFGERGGPAAASTAVDVATESLAQAVYTVLGLAILFLLVEQTDATRWIAAVLFAIVPLATTYVVLRHTVAIAVIERLFLQAAGLFRLDVAVEQLRLSDTIGKLVADRRRILGATALHLVAWVFGAVQVWAAAKAMDLPLSFPAAVALESLVYAARAAFFLVPWHVGVQEGSFVLVGTLLGLDESACLALSLALRARDLLLGSPAVIIWAAKEGRDLVLRRRAPIA